VYAVGLAGLGVVMMSELSAMYARLHPVREAGMVGIAALILAAQLGSERQVLLVAVGTLPLMFAVAASRREVTVPGLAVTLLGVWWIGLALAHAVLLRRLAHGEGIVIDVLVGTFVCDSAAYFGGRLIGQRKLAPRLSPNKTVEGLVVGVVAGTLGVWFASRYQTWMPGSHALVLGLAVSLLGPVGDLFESFVKRDAGAKDTGRLFGAHGGALDRLDAVLFTAVVGYYVWLAYV
jgi:phosphatidate cytidylyltransferase